MNARESDSQEFDWACFRNEMPVARHWAYFDHAAVAPLTRRAHVAIAQWAADAAENGEVHWPSWSRGIERVRGLAARLIGADPAEIALVKNTTDGITLIAEGFPWQDGDNVVTLANEFPTNQYPWLNLASRGVETRRVSCAGGRIDLNRLADACDNRTRIVAVSWVGFLSGWRCDPREVAQAVHDRGALLLLDSIQGLGAFTMDANEWGIDFLAADGHKWMLGPEGAGILYIRREHVPRLRPLGVGWSSVKHDHDYLRIELDLKDSAARYEGGSMNMPGFLGLAGSLETLLDIGLERIGPRIVELTSQLCSRLIHAGAEIYTPRDPRHESGIVSFRIPGRDSLGMKRHALSQGVVLAARGEYLRASPHAYINESDMDRLMSALFS